MLDITKQRDLTQFKICNFVMLVVCIWTRVIHFFWNVFEIFLVWYRDRNWLFMTVGCIPILVFSVFNVFMVVIPTYKRFFKFLHKNAEYKSLPADASEADRRKSIAAMDETAIALLAGGYDYPAGIMAAYVLDALEKPSTKRIEKRQTMYNVRSKSRRMIQFRSTPNYA